MSVFVTIEDQEGELLDKIIEISHLPVQFKKASSSICLKAVSEEEDAVFNQIQLNTLMKELNSLESGTFKKEEKEELEKLLALCQKIKGKKNTYFKFYGERVPEK